MVLNCLFWFFKLFCVFFNEFIFTTQYCFTWPQQETANKGKTQPRETVINRKFNVCSWIRKFFSLGRHLFVISLLNASISFKKMCQEWNNFRIQLQNFKHFLFILCLSSLWLYFGRITNLNFSYKEKPT